MSASVARGLGYFRGGPILYMIGDTAATTETTATDATKTTTTEPSLGALASRRHSRCRLRLGRLLQDSEALVSNYRIEESDTAREVPGLTAPFSLPRRIALMLIVIVLPVLVGSCSRSKPEETTVATDYSSPIASDHLPMPISDYSSPAAVGATPSLDLHNATPEPEPIRGPHTEPVPADQVEKIRTISHGEAIVPGNYLVAGSTTVFEFSSESSPPCQRITPALKRLFTARGDLYLAIVDINRSSVTGMIDWNSPVGMQYSLHSLPFFIIYDGEGDLMLQGRPAAQQLYDWINALAD